MPIDVLNLNNARQEQRQFTQELRLSSPAGATLEYVAGAYYFWQGVDTHTQTVGTIDVLPPLFTGSEVFRDIETQNIAPFGQLTWKVTDSFKLIGGARYTMEQLHAHFERSVYPGAAGPSTALGGPPYLAPLLKADEKDFSYRAGAQYNFTSDHMLYLSYTRGYKGPAINLLNNLSATVVNSGQAVLNPEIAKNLEMGVRTMMFDRKLTLNATVFDEQIEDFQAQTFNSLLNSFTLSNAGKLISKGAEVEAVFAPSRALSLSTNVAYSDTEVKDFIISCYPGQTAAQGCGAGNRQDVTGEQLTNAPKWSYTVAGNYNTLLGSLPYRALLNLTYTHRSSVLFTYRDPNTEQPGYGLLNANVGIEREDGHLRFNVFGRNLTNKQFATAIGTGFLDSSAAGAGYTQSLTTDSRRTFGAEVGVKF